MADARVQAQLADFQLTFRDIDLSVPQLSSHGQYCYSLHLVLVHDGRWNEVRNEQLVKTRDMALRIARNKQHRLSRLSLLADHVHLVAGVRYQQSPQDVALCYLNNLAFAHDMQAIFRPSYYVGTFGNYDTGVIWNAIAASRGPTDTGSDGDLSTS